MSKSVLVIDTPVSCRSCRLNYDSYGMNDVCSLADRITDKYNETNTKPEWCPLMPIPKRQNLKQYTNTIPNIESILAYQYAQGWNDCLQNILETEGEKDEYRKNKTNV